MLKNRTLFISYNGLLEPLLHSQALPYMKGLLRLMGCEFILLTYEKKEDLHKNYSHYIKNLRDNLKKEGIEWYYLRYHKKPQFLAKLVDIINGLIYAIFFVIFRHIKLIHARGVVSGFIALQLHFIFGLKFIFDMRNFLAEAYVSAGQWKINSFNFRSVKFIERLAMLYSSATIVESDFHYQILKKDKYINNLEVIPCCVDLKKFKFRSRAYIDKPLLKDFGLDDRFYLIYIGSLGTWYMMNEMLDFFKILNKDRNFSNSDFIFVTTHSPHLIIETAKYKGIEIEKIKIFNLPHNRMPDILSLSYLGIAFIKPYERMDSFPTKIGEYLASGLPIVLNRGMGDAEKIVEENNVGIIIDSFTEQGYKDGLSKLEDLLKDGMALNVRCRKVAEEYLSLEKGIDKYYQIYLRLNN